MKILQITVFRIVNGYGGGERVFVNMSNHFAQQQQVIDISYDAFDGNTHYPLDSRVKHIKLGVVCDLKVPFAVKFLTECVRPLKQMGMRLESPREVFIRKRYKNVLKKVLEEENPDVVICYDQRTMVAIVECGYNPKNIINMFHDSATSILKQLDYRQKKILRKIGAIQVLLNTDKDLLLKKGYNQVECIGNIVPQFENIRYDNREKKIVCVGRLDRGQKRQHLLVEAFSRIAHQHKDWKLEIYGGNHRPKDYKERMLRLVEKYGLKDQVFFMGVSNRIPEILKGASIFAFPSRGEGWGLALTEAMSSGLPCVGYKNCSAVNELIKDGYNGILCDDGIESLANALSELMKDEAKRLKYGKQAKKDVEIFSEKNIFDKWDELIARIAAGC